MWNNSAPLLASYTWCWKEYVEKANAAKRKAFKAKCIPRHAVHHACQEADKKVYENIDPKSSEVYSLTNQFRRENADVVGEKLMY